MIDNNRNEKVDHESIIKRVCKEQGVRPIQALAFMAGGGEPQARQRFKQRVMELTVETNRGLLICIGLALDTPFMKVSMLDREKLTFYLEQMEERYDSIVASEGEDTAFVVRDQLKLILRLLPEFEKASREEENYLRKLHGKDPLPEGK